jgi:hypothetical protein
MSLRKNGSFSIVQIEYFQHEIIQLTPLIFFFLQSRRDVSGDSEDHPILATARGVFDSTGGVLESKETGLFFTFLLFEFSDATK